MPKMVVELFTHRLNSEIGARPQRPTEHAFRLTIVVEGFVNGYVQAEWGDIVTSMPLSQFHQFCMHSRGTSAASWGQIVQEHQVHHVLPQQIQALEPSAWYLIKASMLTYLWAEVAVLNADFQYLQTHLFDDFVLDYTGTVGNQRHIYFLPESLVQTQNTPLLERLYALSLLSRVTITLEGASLSNYFTPIRYPSQGVFAFDPGHPQGGPTYRLWRSIIASMSNRLRLFTQGGAST